MNNKFVNVEVIRGFDGTEERVITEVDWEKIAESAVYQGVITQEGDNGYIIKEPVQVKDSFKGIEIISKEVKTDLFWGFEIGDVAEYYDVYEFKNNICKNCMSDLLYDEKQKEFYCPACKQ